MSRSSFDPVDTTFKYGVIFLIILLVLALGAAWSVHRDNGRPVLARIACYSGGHLIFEDDTTTRVEVVSGRVSYTADDGHLVRLTGECIVHQIRF